MDRPFNTIVLIHGSWMTALSWENWDKRYQELAFGSSRAAGPAWKATSRSSCNMWDYGVRRSGGSFPVMIQFIGMSWRCGKIVGIRSCG